MPEEKAKVIPVMVALRCRPLIDKEIKEGCVQCLRTIPGEPQVILGKDRAFTYDFAFGPDEPQSEVYENACKQLISSIFKGYNASILAYGQTGSGKTYTMGGIYMASLEGDEEAMGVIPRVLRDLFEGIKEQKDCDFTVRLSYIEIYNEDVNDLLCSSNQREPLAIREETNGSIRIQGLKEVEVTCYEDTIKYLSEGSQGRTTGATAMNSTSSRSHAICTLTIERKRKDDMNDCCKMKFHLVDLAGSERCKRTQAEGDRFKEGVNINKGLLALGNVISALGDEVQKAKHVPYRDSKLTRLLQDSLGGNSHTLMIACVSPADSNIEETLNTLRYADRARKIKNKPIINRDPQAAEIMRLKTLVQQLQTQLLQGGISLSTLKSDDTSSTICSSVTPLESSADEIKKLKERVKELQEENFQLTTELQHSVNQSRMILEQGMKLEASNERLKLKLEQVKGLLGIDLDILSTSMDIENNPQAKEQFEKLQKLSQAAKKEEEEDDNSEDHQEESGEDDDEKNSNDEADDETISTPMRAAHQKHTLRQAELHRELGQINQLLNTKQALADKLQGSDREMQAMKEKYEEMMSEWKAKAEQLEKEKEELALTLHDAQVNANATKVSEQRRQRLKELEQQMSKLKKKMTEQNKVVKLKETSDKQVSKLSTEIQSLKQHRVKLMKQMREETSNFQKWKREKEKEVAKLQQKDRKREFEMQRIKRDFEKQQTVQKRKTAEAIAANKRLKDALDKQKQVESERTGKLEKYDSASIGNRVRKWLSYELDVKVSIREAKYHLTELMENRKVLTERHQQLKDSLEEGPLQKKFSWLGDNGDSGDASMEADEIKKQMTSIELEIELINVQIEEIQQKIVEADQDSKGKSTWQSLHTMNEAKCALKFLLEQAVSARADGMKVTNTLKNVQCQGEADENALKELRAQISQLKAQHQRELTRIETEHEEKLLALMNNDQGSKSKPTDAKTKEKIKLLENKVKRLEGLEQALDEKEKECSQLKQQMTTLMYQTKKVRLLPDLDTTSSPFLDPKPKLDSSGSTLNTTFSLDEPEPPFTRPKTRSSSNENKNSSFLKRRSGDDPDENDASDIVERKKKRKRTLTSLDVANSGFFKPLDFS